MSELPSDLVTYNCPVSCVHWSNTECGLSPVTVECENGERIAADHVIVTVPLGEPFSYTSSCFSYLCMKLINCKLRVTTNVRA